MYVLKCHSKTFTCHVFKYHHTAKSHEEHGFWFWDTPHVQSPHVSESLAKGGEGRDAQGSA